MKDKQNAPNILLVEDSSMIRKYIRRVLSPLDASITDAEDGLIAMHKIKNNSFDLIITDIDMPNMDGIELCQQLKKQANTRGIPIIMVSTLDADEDIDRGFQAGASVYISKTDVQDRLCDTVSDVLSKTSLRKRQLILVIDDSLIIRSIVEEGLSQAGFKVLTAVNGKDALDVITVSKPDLILCDIAMPVMDGFELCRIIQADDSLKLSPFVVMSTNSERGHMKRMLEIGAAAYIVKPFNIDQLVFLVEKILSDHFMLLLKEKERLDVERNGMLSSITSLISALEARDAYTRGHSEAVAKIIKGMIQLTGASGQDVEKAYIGGQLHDIGKIGIRDSVLLKPGKLTLDEYDQIKQHPIIGRGILQSIPSLSDAIDIVYYHHERFDGNGYPEQLKGSKIPLWARITAVADTFHAITSDRPYRLGMDNDQAFDILTKIKVSQLCPDCVDLFFQWFNSK
ncbi:MAG: response regulator receiver modulated metal dependent phosphohydrolase [Candidatus Magnetoglobus multicellularis str. Araruama]|uniref:Response regulator receiver modulated metal dependent phosphohydrolase n=1 Tax=Candidatus Magnetoglobus multicellularis str. Araruama TaxID=890399 RepID=A0A1V1PBY1_9BACT|nr:MAG: response regulator receiver modulated metal dependent phosphohydrolase [Candidatus Magnetoglobus multicellularis str. Araruama]